MSAINAYDEYGIPAPTNSGRFGYTGQTWLPELKLWYYKARMYSPTLGRFLQTDPIGYGDGMNMYNYVGGDPVNFVDPTGLFGVDEDIIVRGRRVGTSSFVSKSPLKRSPVAVTSAAPVIDENEIVVTAKKPEKQGPCSLLVGWTCDGQTKGDNPRKQGGRYNTDLPGGYEAALAAFVGLSRLDGLTNQTSGGFRVNRNPLRPTTTHISDAGNVGIRWAIGDDGFVWRININPNTFELAAAETIHFNGSGQGNMCPTF